MKILRNGSSLLLAIVSAGVFLLPSPVQPQVDQRALAGRVQEGEIAAITQAISLVREVGPSETGPELRSVLISALEDMNSEALAGGPGEGVDPELHLALSNVVADLRDPRSIPALVGTLGHGARVVDALASFGDAAVPLVVRAIRSPGAGLSQVTDGLIVLRQIAGGDSVPPMKAEARHLASAVARERLSGKQAPSTILVAIDLALALEDEELRRIVQALASDPGEIVQRGITDPGLIERIQLHAAAGLKDKRGAQREDSKEAVPDLS